MKKLFIPLLLAAGVAAHADVVIDDFTTGSYSVSLKSGVDYNEQYGSMIGGRRVSVFEVVSNQYHRWNDLDIAPMDDNGNVLQGAFVDGGVNSVTSTSLSYGQDYSNGYTNHYINANWSPLGINQFDLHFLSNDLPLGYAVTVISDNGAKTAVATGTIAGGQDNPFDVLVKYSAFSGSIDNGNIDRLFFSFGTSHSGDFALGSITAQSVPEPISMSMLALGAGSLIARRRRNAAQ